MTEFINDLDFLVADDTETVRHEIEVVDSTYILNAFNEGGHKNTSTDIKKLLGYLSKEFPALYMDYVTSEMKLAELAPLIFTKQ